MEKLYKGGFSMLKSNAVLDDADPGDSSDYDDDEDRPRKSPGFMKQVIREFAKLGVSSVRDPVFITRTKPRDRMELESGEKQHDIVTHPPSLLPY